MADLVRIAGILMNIIIIVHFAAVDADDHALRAELGGELAEELGVFDGGGVRSI